MEKQQTELNIENMQCILTMDHSALMPSRSFSHMHTSYELFYVWQGEVEIKTENKVYRVVSGQAALIPPACYHHTFTKEKTEKFNVFFSFDKNGRRRCEDVYSEFLRTFSINTVKIIKKRGIDVGALRDIQNTDCFCKNERLKAELTRLLFSIYDTLCKNKKQVKTKSTNTHSAHYRYEIERILAKNYNNNVPLDELAGSLYLSPKRLAVIIKSLYGKSFRQLKSEMRIQFAKQLLKESDDTVAVIAQKVGYGSTRGFLLAFGEHEGMTPSEYRKEGHKA